MVLLILVSMFLILGIEEVGIYRVSGIASEIKSLKTAFDESKMSIAFSCKHFVTLDRTIFPCRVTSSVIRYIIPRQFSLYNIVGLIDIYATSRSIFSLVIVLPQCQKSPEKDFSVTKVELRK